MNRPNLVCWKCGTSLSALLLPLSRLAECPKCRAYQHACRLCRYYAPGRPKSCEEQDAEEVTDKETANFCGWFDPRDHAFRAGSQQVKTAAAKSALDGLFGNSAPDTTPKQDVAKSELDKLFGDKT